MNRLREQTGEMMGQREGKKVEKWPFELDLIFCESREEREYDLFWNRSYGRFLDKSNIPPPLIWLRVPMAKFVFVCVCIFVFVYFLSFRVYFVYSYSYLRRICVFPAFSAARSPLLLTSRHLPVNAGDDRWDSPAPFINEPQPAERDFWPYRRVLTLYFSISAKNAWQKMYFHPTGHTTLQDRLEWLTSFYQRETFVASSMIGCEKSFNSMQLFDLQGKEW